MEGVGVALSEGFPSFGGDFGPEFIKGHGEGEAHVSEGDDLDVADGEGEVGRHGTSVGRGMVGIRVGGDYMRRWAWAVNVGGCQGGQSHPY